jgi:7-cyano-7-deazaguanine synthase
MNEEILEENTLCVINSSGGLDSTTLMTKALAEGKIVLPINYNYGQKNIIEMEAQKNVWEFLNLKYPGQLKETIIIDFTETLGNAIKTFQTNRDSGDTEEKTDMKYYMPSRNLLFMTTSLVIAEIIALDQNIDKIELGLGIHKHSEIYTRDYWDISPDFATRLQSILELNDNVKVEVYAPYADKLKADIIADSFSYAVPYELTWTCYEPEKVEDGVYKPCDTCEACLERKTQAEDIGMGDAINDYTIRIKDEEKL